MSAIHWSGAEEEPDKTPWLSGVGRAALQAPLAAPVAGRAAAGPALKSVGRPSACQTTAVRRTAMNAVTLEGEFVPRLPDARQSLLGFSERHRFSW